jgi:DNA excision repair protein ERCC-2
LLQFYFDALSFMRIAEQYSKAYATISEARDKEVEIKLFCIDPSEPLRRCWQNSRAAVLFSATLTPAGYFQSVLGCHADARALNLASPFPHDNLEVFVDSRIPTFYRQRRDSCPELTRTIADLVTCREGHYLVFFPSYEYLALVLECFKQVVAHVEVLVQAPDMSEAEREAFLAQFTDKVERTLVGFAVMGGIFGEGIDLKGERLAGAVIVGVGLPGISPERELIRDYYERTQGRGFEFAYQYPGINRVLQAAGRVIRAETDRGVVLLVDTRYARAAYKDLLPPWWQLRSLRAPSDLQKELSGFWEIRTTAGE